MVLKPFYWNIRQEDGLGPIVASLQHHRRAVTGSMTVMDPSEELAVTKTRHKRSWQLGTSSQENAAPVITATRPSWRRRMLEFEMDGQRFVMSTKRRMSSDFAVHRATDNLDAPGRNRRQREKRGELIGEVLEDSMTKCTLRISFHEDIGLSLPLFCVWLIYGMGLPQQTSTMYEDPLRNNHYARNDQDGVIWGNSHNGCNDGHDVGVGSGGVEDSGSCGMDSGGGSGFE